VAKERGLEIAAAFFSASRSGDMGALRARTPEDPDFLCFALIFRGFSTPLAC
jgi:hypothetical protein